MPLLPLESASSTGRTKQAESWPSGRPAFIRVGEFGTKSRLAISPKKSWVTCSTAGVGGAVAAIRVRDGASHPLEQIARSFDRHAGCRP